VEKRLQHRIFRADRTFDLPDDLVSVGLFPSGFGLSEGTVGRTVGVFSDEGTPDLVTLAGHADYQ
jgi:hypothetical protein